MSDFKHNFIIRAVKLLDVCVMAALFAACWYGYYDARVYVPFYFWGNLAVSLLYIPLFAIVGKAYNAFSISYSRISEMAYSQGISLAVSDAAMWVVSCLLGRGFVTPLPMLLLLLAQCVAAAAWCYGAHKWYFAVFPPKRAILISGQRRDLAERMERYHMDRKFTVQRTVSVEDCVADLSMLDDMEVAFLGGVHSKERNIIVKYAVAHDITCYVIPRLGDVLMRGAELNHMMHLTVLRVNPYTPSLTYMVIKRGFDILLSALALLILSPVFLATAIAIKAEDGGPVFYVQQRLTKGGKVFAMHKFRSMRPDAESDGVARLSAGENDPRITKVGRVIRQLRLDELPQLLDILRGDMSIVGPRPERPEIAAQYEAEMPEFRLRLQAKAGLTGYAQVYGQYNTTPYDKLQMDLLYLSRPSLLEDLRVCLVTVKILFLPESTEGIDADAVTAMDQEDRHA